MTLPDLDEENNRMLKRLCADFSVPVILPPPPSLGHKLLARLLIIHDGSPDLLLSPFARSEFFDMEPYQARSVFSP